MKKVAILTGGLGSERLIALTSAKNVAQALAPHFEVTTYTLPEELPKFLAEHAQFAAAVPIMHGQGGEDGTIQGFLKTLGVPFTFSDVEAHAIGMNKLLTKMIVGAAGVTTSPWHSVEQGTPLVFEHAVVVKPIDSGSAIGVAIAHSQAELDAGLEKAAMESSRIFVEDFIEGDEFSVPVIDLAGETIVLPVISIKPKTTFFDYTAKYTPGMAEELCPAPIPDDLTARLQEVAIKAHLAIGARHVSRSDMIVDQNGEIWFLEINTIPGMSVLLPKAIKASGRDFGEVLKNWITSILTRP